MYIVELYKWTGSSSLIVSYFTVTPRKFGLSSEVIPIYAEMVFSPSSNKLSYISLLYEDLNNARFKYVPKYQCIPSHISYIYIDVC
jgi:hypothetical protein